jgi:hypothetical protein
MHDTPGSTGPAHATGGRQVAPTQQSWAHAARQQSRATATCGPVDVPSKRTSEDDRGLGSSTPTLRAHPTDLRRLRPSLSTVGETRDSVPPPTWCSNQAHSQRVTHAVKTPQEFPLENSSKTLAGVDRTSNATIHQR